VFHAGIPEVFVACAPGTKARKATLCWHLGTRRRFTMGFGRGALLWILGVPLPIIILLALFWHH
jgi:hypothetical protein